MFLLRKLPQLILCLFHRFVQADLFGQVRSSGIFEDGEGLHKAWVERAHADDARIGVHLHALHQPVVLRSGSQNGFASVQEPETYLHGFYGGIGLD